MLGPFGHMRLIPISYALMVSYITLKAQNAICAVRHNNGRVFPEVIEIKRVTAIE